MSGTTNDYDEPRGGQPTTGDGVAGAGAAAADSYGGAVADKSTAASTPGTQNAPAQDMHDTNDEDKIAGIVVQTRSDVGDQDEARITEVLRQRFTDTGIQIADDRLAALAAEVAQH